MHHTLLDADFRLCHLAQQKARRRRLAKLQRQRQQRQQQQQQQQRLSPAAQADLTHSGGTTSMICETSRRYIGAQFEYRAEQMLISQGIEILARRLACKVGEIDLVAKEGEFMVFIEVRQRTRTDFGGAAASVDQVKQHRLLRTAMFYLPDLTRRHFSGRIPRCRFDIIAFEGDQLRWLKNSIQDSLSVR